MLDHGEVTWFSSRRRVPNGSEHVGQVCIQTERRFENSTFKDCVARHGDVWLCELRRADVCTAWLGWCLLGLTVWQVISKIQVVETEPLGLGHASSILRGVGDRKVLVLLKTNASRWHS